jgi:hypothetical protein
VELTVPLVLHMLPHKSNKRKQELELQNYGLMMNMNTKHAKLLAKAVTSLGGKSSAIVQNVPLGSVPVKSFMVLAPNVLSIHAPNWNTFIKPSIKK